WWEGRSATQAVPRPVPRGDQEVVWLNAATSAVAWERFVAAIRRVQLEQSDAGWQIDDTHAFPRETTAVPEVALFQGTGKARLWCRWYKLTGDLKIPDWVEALTHRQPPPLAIIGGSSSDRARDLALALQQAGQRMDPSATPLLLITTATVDEVALPDNPV